jgi:CRP/FNR family cyclic AMP-dependent transcriptional regulator
VDVSSLKNTPLFADVEDDKLTKVATFATLESAAEGKTIIREGGFSNDFYVIEDGTVKVEREGEQVAELGPGDFFGEAGVLEKQQRNATVVAKTRMRLVTLTGWDLRRMRKQLGPVMDKLEQAIEQRRQAIPGG